MNNTADMPIQKEISMIIISPSVLAADFSRLGEQIKRVEDAGAEYLHLDVMDGIFVPNISFGSCVISALRKDSKMVFDVHLMITDPIRYVDDFIKAGADIITIHYESCEDPLSVVRYIRSRGVKASVSVKPQTPIEVLYPMLNELDMALIMTVEPGFGGQKLIPETDIITIHYESCEDPLSVVRYIRSRGVKASVSVKPQTPIEVLYPMLNELDMALIMTVEPGFGGQKLIPETVSKVRKLRDYASTSRINIDIEVDGGVGADNLAMLTDAGANVIVAGSSIFKAADPQKAIEDMRAAAMKA